MLKRKPFKCEHCDKRFVREDAFVVHKCKQLIRIAEMQTAIGRAAYGAYASWLKQARRAEPLLDTFLHSSQYVYFMKFAKFLKQTEVRDRDAYIKIMISNDRIPPAMWSLVEAHSLYLNQLDRLKTPLEMVSYAIDTIIDTTSECGVDTGQFFSVTNANDVIMHIRKRELTPWLLLKSSKFMNFYHASSAKDRTVMNTLINYDFWYKKLDKNKSVVKDIKAIVAELNL